jgi:hypothetical protein
MHDSRPVPENLLERTNLIPNIRYILPIDGYSQGHGNKHPTEQESPTKNPRNLYHTCQSLEPVGGGGGRVGACTSIEQPEMERAPEMTCHGCRLARTELGSPSTSRRSVGFPSTGRKGRRVGEAVVRALLDWLHRRRPSAPAAGPSRSQIAVER